MEEMEGHMPVGSLALVHCRMVRRGMGPLTPASDRVTLH